MHGQIEIVFVSLGAFTALVFMAWFVYLVVRLNPYAQPLLIQSFKSRQGVRLAGGSIGVSGTITSDGANIDTYTFKVASVRQRLILQANGPTSVWAGVFYTDGQGNPVLGQGQVSVCGSSSYCVHVFPKVGQCVIIVSGARIPSGFDGATPAGGTYSLKLRKYVFLLDDIQLKLHPNTC